MAELEIRIYPSGIMHKSAMLMFSVQRRSSRKNCQLCTNLYFILQKRLVLVKTITAEQYSHFVGFSMPKYAGYNLLFSRLFVEKNKLILPKLSKGEIVSDL